MRHLVVWFLLVLATVASAARFTTQRWSGQFDIKPDGTVSVREIISVTFMEPQHGLIRKIPMRTAGPSRQVRSVFYGLESVKQDSGAGFVEANVGESEDGGNWVLKIGSSGRTVSGPVTYEIDYTVNGAVTPFAQDAKLGPHSEFLWNLTPTDWPTAIERSDFTIRFPKPEAGGLLARILVGARGTRKGIEINGSNTVVGDSRLVTARFDGQALVIRPQRSLSQGEVVTMDLALPGRTVVAPPPQIQTATEDRSFDFPNNAFSSEFLLLGFLPVLGIPLAYLLAHRRWGPPKKPMTVQFDPPPGVSPSLAGLVLDGNVDQRDIVAGIVTLAQKGGLRMHHPGKEGEGVVLELLDKDRIRGAEPFDTALYDALAPFGPVITPDALRGTFWPYYQELVSMVNTDAKQKGLMVDVGGTKAGAFVLTFVAVGILTVVTLCVSPCLAIPSAFVALVVGGILIGKISPLTSIGHETKWRLEGLFEFISRAHQRELSYMSERMPDQALFEKLLPYAVAFNLTKQWAQAFAGIDLRMPDWYAGDAYGMDPFWTAMMVSDLMDFDQSFGHSISYNPATGTSDFDSGGFFSSGDSGFGGSWDSGSGDFGGGFDAGGGGGGGGGDSW